MEAGQPTRRCAGWKRRAAVWVMVCAVLGLVTTVGVAWFGALDSQRGARWFRSEFRADAISGGAREDVEGAWSIYASPLGVHITGGFSASPPETPADANADEAVDEASDDEAEDDWDEDEDEESYEDGYTELVPPKRPELHEMPHGRERWGALTYGENPALSETELPRYTRGSGLGVVQQEFAAGWPRLALWSQRRLVGPMGNRTETFEGEWLFGRAAGRNGSSTFSTWLPLLPIWRGLLIDTAFWGGVWFVLLWPTGLVAGKIKRVRRRKRGRCAWCRYDLRGIEGAFCPECGKKKAAGNGHQAAGKYSPREHTEGTEKSTDQGMRKLKSAE